MHTFLTNNRDELIERCTAKVAQRLRRAATVQQLANGIPLFLAQLASTLEAEEQGDAAGGERISGPAGGDAAALSQIGVSASAHGKVLMKLGYSVDQVVHDYGDLCQAITDLAVERDAPFTVDQFRTLNRCLDNAIADAVTEFSAQRDAIVSLQHSADENERLGELVHELRNFLQTATMGFAALESGRVQVRDAAIAVDLDMRQHRQHPVPDFLLESVHHRQHDDQRGDTERNAGDRQRRDERDEAVAAARPAAAARIAKPDEPLERRNQQALAPRERGFASAGAASVP